MTYERFFKQLEICGGCTGHSDKKQCRFAVVCAYVEKLARKGVIKSSKDFCYPISSNDDLMCYTDESYLPRAATIRMHTVEIPAGIGPCTAAD